MGINYAELIAAPLRETRVHVPAWGDDLVRLVRANTIRLAEYMDLQAGVAANEKGEPTDYADALRMAVSIVSMTIADEDGGRPLDDAEGRAFLERQDTETLNLLVNECTTVNGISDGYDGDDTKKN